FFEAGFSVLSFHFMELQVSNDSLYALYYDITYQYINHALEDSIKEKQLNRI
ncbi:19462_t:CDS:1, partial [Gigaspora rosea]